LKSLKTPTFWRFGIAVGEWVSYVTIDAGAEWCMIDDTANGILTAGSWAGVAALLVNTRLLTRTFRVYSTLWATIGSLTNKVRQAGTGRHSVNIAALGVGTTGCWYTGIPKRFILGLNNWRCGAV